VERPLGVVPRNRHLNIHLSPFQVACDATKRRLPRALPEYRHLIVLEASHRKLFRFIDVNLEQARGLVCNPMPPTTAFNKYDNEYFEHVDDLVSFGRRTRREQAMDERRLAQMIPDVNFRQQLQVIFILAPRFRDSEGLLSPISFSFYFLFRPGLL
jgi:hypothetical protein